MENASEAIVMAGAILIFVMALSIAMTLFTQARATADVVLYASDPTNYYESLDISSNIKNRIVGLETIIPTLYKYYKENYTVVFLEKGEKAQGLTLYQTQTNPLVWSGNTTNTVATIPPIVNKYPGMDQGNKKEKINICSFDVDEETARHEPWTGSTTDYKANMDAFLNGEIFYYPSDSSKSYNYSKTFGTGGFVEKYKNTKFRETIGEYSIEEKSTFTAGLDNGIRNNKNKRIIIYQVY